MSLLLVRMYAWLVLGQRAPLADALMQRVVVEGTANTRNIAVVGTFLKAPIVAMTRIENSDVWYLTTTVPSGARFTYWLVENSPMVTEGPQVLEMLAALQADLLNPHRTCASGAPL